MPQYRLSFSVSRKCHSRCSDLHGGFVTHQHACRHALTLPKIPSQEHARRKTVTAMDVVYALRRQGRTLYGEASLMVWVT